MIYSINNMCDIDMSQILWKVENQNTNLFSCVFYEGKLEIQLRVYISCLPI